MHLKNPTQLRSNLIYLGSLLELNQVDKAMEVMNQLIANYPVNARVFTLLGDGYIRHVSPEKPLSY
ncbi:MAG: hypothetical protein ACJASL_003899 [Paraglaciecola sp.]|jgi:hypothetical protein